MQTTIRSFVEVDGVFTLTCAYSDLENLNESWIIRDSIERWKYLGDKYITPRILNNETFEEWRACILLAETYFDLYGDESVLPQCKAIEVTLEPQEIYLTYVRDVLNVLVW